MTEYTRTIRHWYADTRILLVSERVVSPTLLCFISDWFCSAYITTRNIAWLGAGARMSGEQSISGLTWQFLSGFTALAVSTEDMCHVPRLLRYAKICGRKGRLSIVVEARKHKNGHVGLYGKPNELLFTSSEITHSNCWHLLRNSQCCDK